jgi:site-specific DNA-methyltransferase (adenine-specific)
MIHLHHDNSFSVLGGIADASIDATITDPPYGTTALPWDKAIDYSAFWREAERVTKETALMIVFGAQPMLTDLINSNRRHFRYELIWHKTSPVGFLDAKQRPLRAHENIAVFCRRWRGKGNTKISTYNPQFWFGKPYREKARGSNRCSHYGNLKDVERSSDDGRRYPVSVLTFANRTGGHSYHPTAKPLDLMRWLINSYTEPGECVLDPFMGSGSTGVAAVELGRSFIGVELDEAYFYTAQQRIDEVILRSAGLE